MQERQGHFTELYAVQVCKIAVAPIALSAAAPEPVVGHGWRLKSGIAGFEPNYAAELFS